MTYLRVLKQNKKIIIYIIVLIVVEPIFKEAKTNTFKRRTLSLLFVFFLLVGIVGIVNIDITYDATKMIHLKKIYISLVAGKTY